MDWNWKDIIGAIILVIFVVWFLVYYFSSHPSDKYHNDTWKEDRKRKK